MISCVIEGGPLIGQGEDNRTVARPVRFQPDSANYDGYMHASRMNFRPFRSKLQTYRSA